MGISIIEQIIQEADVYGLQQEVTDTANKFMQSDPTLAKLDAYIMAFDEWVK